MTYIKTNHPFGSFIVAVIVALVFSVSRPAAAQEGPFGAMTRLAGNVYHYFGGFYSSLVVVSDDGVLITDTANTQRAEHLKGAIAKLTDQPVTKVIFTHEHFDHVGGYQVFEGAEIICQENCLEDFELDTFGITPGRVDVSYDDFKNIDFGGVTVELHHFGPADGDATTIVYLPREKIAVSSDIYLSRTLTEGKYMADYSYAGTRKTLNEMVKWDIDHAITAHSPDTSRTALDEHAEFVNDLYDAVYAEAKKAYESGTTYQGGGALGISRATPAMQEAIKLPRYESWKNYDALPAHVKRMADAFYHGD